MDSDILVSIGCTAYNHQKYIRKTLDGFVNQITDFRYEIIVHDDASTDKTADVIREYQERYPNLITAIYQTENQQSQNIKVTAKFIMPKMKGKYIALCEGDDYWVDNYKLQKQVDIFRNHPECYMCVHKVQEIFEDGSVLERTNPPQQVGLKTQVLCSKDFLTYSLSNFFHTSSYMMEGEFYRCYHRNYPEFREVCDVGDICMKLYFGQLGSVYYIDDIMSYYRRGVPTSWSNQNASSINHIINHSFTMKLTLIKFDEYTNGIYHDICVHDIAKQLRVALVLSGRAKDFLKKENREYFMSFALYQRLFLILVMIFPGIGKRLGKLKIYQSNRKKGLVR